MGTIKAKLAAVGATLTALLTALATASTVLDDDKVDITEISTIAGAVAALAGTVYAVWRVPNRSYDDGSVQVRGTVK